MPIIQFTEEDIPSEALGEAVQDCIDQANQRRDLKRWQRDALDDFQRQLDAHGFLTSGQRDVLNSLVDD